MYRNDQQYQKIGKSTAIESAVSCAKFQKAHWDLNDWMTADSNKKITNELELQSFSPLEESFYGTIENCIFISVLFVK